MSLFRKLRGTIETVWQIGINSTAILLKNVSGVLALRNKADSAYINLQTNGVQLFDSDGSNKITVTAPGTVGTDYTLTLPDNDGSPGQVLSTDGSGGTSWADAGNTAACIKCNETALAFGTASPLTLFTLPANAHVHEVKTIVDTGFDGTAPTVSVGIAGNTSKYTGTGDVDLKTANAYSVEPDLAPVGTTEALIATYSADSSTAGAARIQIFYSNPD